MMSSRCIAQHEKDRAVSNCAVLDRTVSRLSCQRFIDLKIEILGSTDKAVTEVQLHLHHGD